MIDGDADGPKLYRFGTHRTTDPESTLARVMPLAKRMGITRVAVLTGLDTVGIPVAAAIRPNSRSIAVHQGKGLSLAAAKASAVMEAVEAHHAENLRLDLRLASYAELGTAATNPAELPRALRGPGDVDRLLWTLATDLISGRKLFVPYELVSADFTYPIPQGMGLFQATTNGLASGNHWLEAVLHGLYETIERDAVALWRAAPAVTRDARMVDPSSLGESDCAPLLRMFARAGVSVAVWDVTSDIKLPAFLCLAASFDASDAVEPELGSGCHVDRDVALSRAVTEAAQARLTRISGARDDFPGAGWWPQARAGRRAAAQSWVGVVGRRNFLAAPNCAGPTLRHDLVTVLARLETAGVRHAAWVDLTDPDIGIPVVRVAVPGLEGPWTGEGGEYTQGARAKAVKGFGL